MGRGQALRKKRILIALLLISTISLFIAGTSLVIVTPRFGMEWKVSLPAYSSVEMTSDGGFITMGTPWLVKLDMNGNSQWSKLYPDANFSKAQFVDQTTDGGYIISGWTVNASSSSYDYEQLIIKVDEYGNEEWNKTFASGIAAAYIVRHTSDGGCVLIGWQDNLSIIKIYSDGSEQWNRTYTTTADFHIPRPFRVIRQSSDLGYVLLCSGYWRGYHSWILKTNESGYPEWNRTIIYGWNELYSIQQTSDGGYLLSGTTDLSELGNELNHAMLLKLFSNGSTQWISKYSEVRSYGGNALQTSDGGYIVAVVAPWWFLGGRACIWKTDANGATLWCTPLDIDTMVNLFRQTPDGGYMLGWSIGLAKVSGSPPLLSTDTIFTIYTASFWLLLATVVTGAVLGLMSISAGITSKYRGWREKPKLEPEDRHDEDVEGTRKGRLLQNLNRVELLTLAKLIPNGPANDEASRSELIGIIKASLSIEEIQDMLRVADGKRPRIRRRDFPPYNA